MTLPFLHVVTTDEVVTRPDFLRTTAEILSEGGEHVALHVRLREVTDRRFFEIAVELEELTIESGAWLVVNRRLDIALAAGADAVQLGRGAILPSVAQDMAQGALRVGASVHDLAEADRARLEGADYLVAGSVYPTASHPGAEPAGMGFLRSLRPLPLPIIAIGGLTPSRVREVMEAGADGVAAVGSIWNAAEPAAAAREYLRAWKAT